MPSAVENPVHPLYCILSADARFSPVDFANDQIWELTTNQNEPPALTLLTTYGLRAHWMRIFPTFTSSNTTLSDPRAFAVQPVLETSAPSYARVSCNPFPNFDVQMEYWVPASNIISGRLKVTNRGDRLENWKVAYNALLNPISMGQKMTTYSYGLNTVLQGNTQNVTPVFYITGGPEPSLSPYPALNLSLTLQPGQSRTFTWALASFRSLEESFNHARQMTGHSWDADLLLVEMAEKKHLYQINTSQTEWDRVFSHSQRQALQLLMTGPARHPGKTFVVSRRPDFGYSVDGSGNDYKPAWIGQTALNAWAFCKCMLPGYAEIAQNVLDAFIEAQRPDGFISNQLALTNHLSPDHAFPILAEISTDIYAQIEDKDWLRRVYPALVRYLHYWFYTGAEEDLEFLPTWSSPTQAGLDDLPAFNPSHGGALAGILPHLAMPGLYSLLFKECSRLITFAEILQETADLDWLNAKKHLLAESVDACWNKTSKSYRTLDVQSKSMLRPQKLITIRKNGKTLITKALKIPGRITLEVFPGLSNISKLLVAIHGKVNAVPVSLKVTANDFKRSPDSSSAYCPTLFDAVDNISVQGLEAGSKLTVAQPDSTLEEITQLLPLWAGIPSKTVADQLVQKTIYPRYHTEQGLSTLPRPKNEGSFPQDTQVSLMWNLFILDGLHQYGYQKEAAEIMQALILQAADILRNTGSLYPAYSPDQHKPAGEPDSLNALIPPLDFLNLLGVDHWSNSGMVISAMNTFFAPITVEYDCIKCTFLSTETVIQMLNGESQSVTTPPMRKILFP